MGFSRREYWSGSPFPTPGNLPDPGLNPHLLHWQVDSLPLRHLGSINMYTLIFSASAVVKNMPANAGDMGLVPESARAPVVGNGNPLQYSCLGNHVDTGAW